MAEKSTETAKIFGYILARSDKAIKLECWEMNGISLLDDSGSPPREWFPLSQCTAIHKTPILSEKDYIEVPVWLLRKKEMY